MDFKYIKEKAKEEGIQGLLTRKNKDHKKYYFIGKLDERKNSILCVYVKMFTGSKADKYDLETIEANMRFIPKMMWYLIGTDTKTEFIIDMNGDDDVCSMVKSFINDLKSSYKCIHVRYQKVVEDNNVICYMTNY